MGKKLTVTCPCGKTITKYMSDTQTYCSHRCKGKYGNTYQERKLGEVRPCYVCNKEVYIPRARLGKAHYFCCVTHQNEWQSRNKLAYTCKVCATIFKVSPSRKVWDNPQYCSLKCRDADPDVHRRLLDMNVSQQKRHQTKPERIGYSILDNIKVEYLPQYVIGDKFCVDAFIPSMGVVIQFDGDYWHGNKELFPVLDTRQQKRVRLDQSQDAYMRACGYVVVRIWASDLSIKREVIQEQLYRLLSHV